MPPIEIYRIFFYYFFVDIVEVHHNEMYGELFANSSLKLYYC